MSVLVKHPNWHMNVTLIFHIDFTHNRDHKTADAVCDLRYESR